MSTMRTLLAGFGGQGILFEGKKCSDNTQIDYYVYSTGWLWSNVSVAVEMEWLEQINEYNFGNIQTV